MVESPLVLLYFAEYYKFLFPKIWQDDKNLYAKHVYF